VSDRTPVQLTVYDCPPSQAAAALRVIHEYGLRFEFLNEGQPADDQLGLGLTYMDPEVPCGSAQLIAHTLQESAPRASWEVWEDPAYEWLGDLYRFTPDLGLWTANCDTEGTPLFTPDDVHRLAALPNTTDEPARARALGQTHDDRLHTLATANEGAVLAAAT